DYGTNKEEELRRRSAVYWADQFPKDVPVLLLHGNADWRVKSSAALRLALELDAHRVPYRLVVYEGGDHGLDAFRDEVHREIIRWFDRYVKHGEEAPKMEYHGE
ncbi:MAG: prolyl oligopeptidase family serine peptidase, partial [Chitinophagaceae bacterium]|nr:prolyl oligopeptidase family serine peptidase [Chitinophagaceae bacterium]